MSRFTRQTLPRVVVPRGIGAGGAAVDASSADELELRRLLLRWAVSVGGGC